MKRIVGAVVVALLIAMAVALWWQGQRAPSIEAGIVVAGGDGGGLPRATPQEEKFAPAALEAALAEARAEQAQVFLVLRHGHLILEHYGRGIDATSLVDGGPFSELLVAFATGIAIGERGLSATDVTQFDANRLSGAIAADSGMPYVDYLAQRLWQPVNAAAARLIAPAGQAAEGYCCLAARSGDWLRMAVLLLDDGRFEGNQVLPAGWATAIRQPRPATPGRGFGLWLASAAQGAEPFAADGVVFLRGPGRWRLWLAPALHLAVLFGGEGAQEGWDETRLPNLVIRAIIDRQTAAQGSQLKQLVPEH